MGRKFVCLFCFLCLVSYIFGLPVSKKNSGEKDDDEDYDDDVHQLSYKKYLKEVMSLLMTDDNFKKKMLTEGKNLANKAKEFSSSLDFVSHGIRTQLDELKRKELDRMRNLMKLKSLLKASLAHLTDIPELKSITDYEKERLLGHLDPSNVNSFEPSDLEKLIVQTTKDLNEIDEKRKEAFKNYEIEKELERREKLEKLEGEKRDEEIMRMKKMEDKHKNHSKIHHPGNEAQLMDVWEDIDGLDKSDFDPRTFFHIHDINNDGFWDDNEVEALFQKELDKVYDPTAPEDDMVERYEEMNRMREHMVSEADKDKDGLISRKEFVAYSDREEFKTDEEWQAIDGSKMFNEEELTERKMIKLKQSSPEAVEEHLVVESRKLGDGSMGRVEDFSSPSEDTQPLPSLPQNIQHQQNVQQPPHKVQQPQQNVQQPQKVQQPPQNVQQPPQDVQQTQQSVQQPQQNVQQPQENLQQTQENVQQFKQNVQQPQQNVQKPPQNVHQPPQNVQQPQQSVHQPQQNVNQPQQNIQKPPQNVQRHPQDVQQPQQNLQQPPQNVQEAQQNVQQPLQNVQQPLQNVQQPPQKLQFEDISQVGKAASEQLQIKNAVKFQDPQIL